MLGTGPGPDINDECAPARRGSFALHSAGLVFFFADDNDNADDACILKRTNPRNFPSKDHSQKIPF